MLDIIGTIFDAEGIALPGWHVNSPESVSGWEAFQVTPSTPQRVFAGHATFFYTFADEAEFTTKAVEAGFLQPEPQEVAQ